jgi:hypothetical protein
MIRNNKVDMIEKRTMKVNNFGVFFSLPEDVYWKRDRQTDRQTDGQTDTKFETWIYESVGYIRQISGIFSKWPIHFFRVQKTKCGGVWSFGQLNIYCATTIPEFNLQPLSQIYN